jgi:hypothetical protein
VIIISGQKLPEKTINASEGKDLKANLKTNRENTGFGNIGKE